MMQPPHPRTAATVVLLAIVLATGVVSAPARAAPSPFPESRGALLPPLEFPPNHDQRNRLWRKFRDTHHHALVPGWDVPRPNHSRAMVELGAILVLETAIYYAIGRTQEGDWDTRVDARYLGRRMFTLEYVRFDNNAFWYNNLSHPLLGSFYYQVARTNDLGPGPALAITLLGAGIWEYACEMREKVSINDLVTTTVGGMALGETVAQLGAFFERGSGSWLHRGIAGLLSPTRALHRHVDHTSAPRAERLDGLGLPADVGHRFDASIGWAMTRTATSRAPRPGWRGDVTLDLDLRLLNVLGAGSPGAFSDRLAEGNVSRLAASVAFGGKGLREFRFLTRAGIVGHYLQDITAAPDGGRRGYALYVGGATSFDFSAWEGAGLLGNRFDMVSNSGILGPLLTADWYLDGCTLSASAEAYPTFSLVRSLAFPEWRVGRRLDGIPSVLREEGYYFAMGLLALGEFRVQAAGFEATATLRYESLWSLNGADRLQEQVTDEIAPSDRRLAMGVRLSYQVPGTRTRFGVAAGWARRAGDLRQAHVLRTDTTLGADVGFVF